MAWAVSSKKGGLVSFLFALLLIGHLGLFGCEAPQSREASFAEVPIGGPLAPQGTLQSATLRSGDGVIDGDTLRAVGFDQTIRLLCVDAEETFESDEDRDFARRDWDSYQAQKESKSDRFGNYGTLLGEEATAFAREFFTDGEEVFLEYQSPERTRGFFGRHLAMVWKKGEDGSWLNFNVELVRAGLSPYFINYGRCDSYDSHFREAQREAQELRRGIWAEKSAGYRDYEERLLSWENRARQIDLYRRHFYNDSKVIKLGTDTTLAQLRLVVGERVIIFGALERHAPRARPPKLHFFHRFREDLVVIPAEGVDFEEFRIQFTPGEYYYVEGVVELYRGNPQIKVDRRSFIRGGLTPPN